MLHDQQPSKILINTVYFYSKPVIVLIKLKDQSKKIFGSFNFFINQQYFLSLLLQRLMEELKEDTSITDTPFVKIAPLNSIKLSKLSRFSLLHRESTCSDNRCTQVKEACSFAECRICLENSSESPIIKPCKCQGMIEYTHEKCLQQWIKQKIQKGEVDIKCQLCQTLFNYQSHQIKKIACNQFRINWQERKKQVCCFLTLYFIGFIIFITFVGLLIATNVKSELRFKLLPNKAVLITQIAVVVLGFVFLLLMTIRLFNQYIIKRQIVLSVKEYRPKRRVIKKQKTNVSKV